VTTLAPTTTPPIYVGVDTHKNTHTYAVVDATGQHLATRTFGTSGRDLDAAIGWVTSVGQVQVWGVECTGSYGQGLTVALLRAGQAVLDVRNPVAGLRGRNGKDDQMAGDPQALAEY
jgi:hypothetical protein